MGSSSQIDVSQKLRDSDDLLKQGDAVLDNSDIETAIQLFGSALESRVAAFGELGEECAVAYFKYGSALFVKSQRDTDVLGPAGQKLEQGKEEEEDVEAEEDEASKSKGKGKGKVEETDDAADGADAAEEEDLEEAEDGDEEEESDQELAWRLLETARCIYAKRESRSLEEVDVISTLADLSLEKEDFDACMEDYQHALHLLSLLVSPHHRRVIELYFKMALANQTGNRASEALRCCRQAIDACEKRVAQAQSLLEAKRKVKTAGKEGGESLVAGGSGAAAAEGASVGVVATKDADEAAEKEVKGEAKGEVKGEEEKKEDEKKEEEKAQEEKKEEEKKEEEKDEAKAGETAKSSVDKGKGKGKAEEGTGIPYDSIDASSSEEELVREIQDVQQIASDLKEKAEELQEMIRLPSVEAMMREQLSAVFSGATSSSAPPTTAAAAAAAAAPAAVSAPAAAAPAAAAPAITASGVPSAAAAAGGKAGEGEQRGEKRAAEVAVMGRSKKRLTPVPVPPEEAAVLSWPGVAS